jgi:hypothetical protein
VEVVSLPSATVDAEVLSVVSAANVVVVVVVVVVVDDGAAAAIEKGTSAGAGVGWSSEGTGGTVVDTAAPGVMADCFVSVKGD